MSGGGSSGGTKTVTTTGSGEPQLVPEFRPFGKRVGELALEALDFPELDLRRFAQDVYLPISGLSPFEQQARGLIWERGTQGIPVPFPELMAGEALAGAGDTASNWVQRATGGLTSGLTQQALQGLESQITPAMQNAAAKFGLGQSGELPASIGRAYAQQLVPIYQQGMQAEQNAMNMLTNAQLGMANPLLQMGAREEQRAIEQLNELTKFGEMERNLEQAQNLSLMDSYLRARDMALGLVNPFGSFASSPQLPSSVTESLKTSDSGGGLGFGK